MTKYKSHIVLGQVYRDKRTGIQGFATALSFQQNGCSDVTIEQLAPSGEEGKTSKLHPFWSTRLELVDGQENAKSEKTYKSDIKLGERYTDKDGIEGTAASIEFHEDIATRVNLQVTYVSKLSGAPDFKYVTIDEFLLTRVRDNKSVEKKGSQTGALTTWSEGPR